MSQSITEGFSARDAFRVIFRRKALIFLIVFMSVLMMGVYSYLVLPTFEASARILIVAQRETPMPMSEALTPLRAGIDVAFTQREVIMNNAIVGEVVKTAGLDTRPDPTGIKGAVKVWLDDLAEKISDWKDSVKGRVIEKLTGKAYVPHKKASDFEKEVNRLSSKRVVQVDAMERTDILTIRVRDYDPEMAARIANAFGQAYILFNMQNQLEDLNRLLRPSHPRVVQLQKDIQIQRARLQNITPQTLESLAGQPTSGEIKFVQVAVPPSRPILPKKTLNVAIAFVLSLVVALGFTFLLEGMDPSLKTPADIAEIFQAPILGSIRFFRRRTRGLPLLPATLKNDAGALRASVQSIASELLLMKMEYGPRVILVAGVDRGDGKTSLAVNVASVIAGKIRRNVLLVDADLWHSKLAKALKLPRTSGLSDLARGQAKSWKDLIQHDAERNISVLAAGQPFENGDTFLGSDAMKRLIEEAKQEYDWIIIDTPSLRYHKDALRLSDSVSGAVMVVRTYQTRRQLARIAAGHLERFKLPVLGVVMNFRRFEIPESVYQRI